MRRSITRRSRASSTTCGPGTRAARSRFLYVTHSHREVFALGERVLLLRDGAIVADGTPDQVLNMPSQEPSPNLAGFENLSTSP